MSKHNGKAKFATSISVLCLHRVIDYYVMSLAFRDHPSNHNCMYTREFDVSNKYLQQRILQCHIIYFYHLPINMRKGNVFSHVCPSVNYSIHGAGVPVQGFASPRTGPWLQPLSVQDPCPYHTPLPGPALHPDMFILVRLPNMFKLVHYEARTVGKPVVGIRLKCLLLYLYDCSVKYSPLIEDLLRNYMI